MRKAGITGAMVPWTWFQTGNLSWRNRVTEGSLFMAMPIPTGHGKHFWMKASFQVNRNEVSMGEEVFPSG